MTPPTMQARARAIAEVRTILSDYTFRAVDEHDLSVQVTAILQDTAHFHVRREVAGPHGRYDILIEVIGNGADDPSRRIRLVLELKVSGTAEAAERQAQRYTRDDGIDAVAVVTSSRRLALEILRGGAYARLEGVECLGGKPFGVIALRAL